MQLFSGRCRRRGICGGARSLLRCRVDLGTQLVDEFQVLLKGHHAIHWVVRGALLHAYEKLRRQV